MIRKFMPKLIAVFTAFLMVLTMMPLASQTAYAEGGSTSNYVYRFDLPSEKIDSTYTKLGIVLFPGDTLRDISEDSSYEEDGCTYQGLYMGFARDSVDTTLCDVDSKTASVSTEDGDKYVTGDVVLTIKGSKPVAIDGGNVVTEGPYVIMENGKQVMHTTVNYKNLNMRVLGEYPVTYDLDGGNWKGSNPNKGSFQPDREDYDYALSSEEPVREGYVFTGWKGDSRTGAISLDYSSGEGYKLVIKGLYSTDEETMQDKLSQANALYNNGGYKLTAEWEKEDEVITRMDIHDVWTYLSAADEIAYTTEFGDGLDSMMEFVDQFCLETAIFCSDGALRSLQLRMTLIQ